MGEIKWTKVSSNYLAKYKEMMDLYFKFIKHAFGLPYRDEYLDRDVQLRLFFDEIPDTHEQNDDFKAHLCYLQELQQFKKTRIKIQHDFISEIDSHKHSIQQCMDIILGAMAFRLNDLHLEIPEGATEPGKKATEPDTAKGRWNTSYRHWKFIPTEFREKKA